MFYFESDSAKRLVKPLPSWEKEKKKNEKTVLKEIDKKIDEFNERGKWPAFAVQRQLIIIALVLVAAAIIGLTLYILPKGEMPFKKIELYFALITKDYEKVKILLKTFPCLMNEKCLMNKKPIFVAIDKNDLRMVEILLKYGVDPDAKGVFDESPIHIAAKKKNLRLMKILISNGASVNNRSGSGETALHLAATKDCKDLVKMLAAMNANPNIQDNTGKTPLHKSAFKGLKEMSELLLEQGADPNIRDGLNKFPFEYAAKKNEILADLLQKEQEYRAKYEEAGIKE